MFIKILAATTICLIAAIILGTVIAFATGNANPGATLRAIEKPPAEDTANKNNSGASETTFTGIKQIRAVTKPNPKKENDTGTLVIITPWFTYPSEDTAFYEELSRKSGILRSSILIYFSQHTEEELSKLGEQKVKADLRNVLNNELVLGKISDIYFTDYIFFE